ncbi:semaphorin-1A-like isoform X2 [Frankliniella occidentalis]|uniref:Semaphorin-1A-like isoform X2 n=1 Tax=Frankliniella occidentalis TaxID=133901 RepID=A0A9C6TVQ6_FRAOC|nr:semaphorin-1A-like isoform X2 [Frankliniella occidentalis]
MAGVRDQLRTCTPSSSVAVFVAAFFALTGVVVGAWVQDVPARLVIGYGLEDEIQMFKGNESHRDHFKLLQREGSALLVGARNIVYNISLRDLNEFSEQVCLFTRASSVDTFERFIYQ